MSVDEKGVPIVPKRKQRAAVELEAEQQPAELPVELADEPVVPSIRGLVMARVPGGYMLIDVAIPEADLGRYATKVRPPEIYAIVRSQAEKALDDMCETLSNGALSVLRTRGGMYEPITALAALHEEIALLAEAYWPGRTVDAHAELEVFWRTGELALAPSGRQPNGDDRGRLQRLAHHAGGWPGVVAKAAPFGGGAA